MLPVADPPVPPHSPSPPRNQPLEPLDLHAGGVPVGVSNLSNVGLTLHSFETPPSNSVHMMLPHVAGHDPSYGRAAPFAVTWDDGELYADIGTLNLKHESALPPARDRASLSRGRSPSQLPHSRSSRRSGDGRVF